MLVSKALIFLLPITFTVKPNVFANSACSEQGITEWTKYDFPNPQVDINKCGRCLKSWVCDPNNILPDFRASVLDKKINDIRDSSRCVCSSCSLGERGYSIAIAIVDRMKDPGYSDTAIENTAKDFVKYLLGRWDFETCENDVVIFLSHRDRKIFTEAGLKAKEILGYNCLERIYEEAKSQLTAGNYANALEYMIEQYKLSLEQGSCSVKLDSVDVTVLAIVFSVFGSIVLIVFIVFCCACCRGGSSGLSWGGGGGGGGGDGGGGGGGDGGGGF